MQIFVFTTQLYYIKTLKTTCLDPCGIIVREYFISYWMKHLETNLYIVNFWYIARHVQELRSKWYVAPGRADAYKRIRNFDTQCFGAA
jgi:hypothetical protein